MWVLDVTQATFYFRAQKKKWIIAYEVPIQCFASSLFALKPIPTERKLNRAIMGSLDWGRSPDQRQDTVDRIADNIINLAFNRGNRIDVSTARRTAVVLEKKAYATAQVESKTTTGARPVAETEQAYVRLVAGQRKRA